MLLRYRAHYLRDRKHCTKVSKRVTVRNVLSGFDLLLGISSDRSLGASDWIARFCYGGQDFNSLIRIC